MALHLAAALAATGRTLLVDTDPQRAALTEARGLAGFAGDDPRRCSSALAMTGPDLTRRLDQLRAGYTWTVLDTPSADLATVRAAVRVADAVLVPWPPAIGLVLLAPTLELLASASTAGWTRPWAVLLTQVSTDTADLRAALAARGAPVLDAELPHRGRSGHGGTATALDYAPAIADVIALIAA